MTVLKLQTNRHSHCRKAFNFNDWVSVLYIVKIHTLVLSPHFLLKCLIYVPSATSAMQLWKQGTTVDAPFTESGKNVFIKSPRLKHIFKAENVGTSEVSQWAKVLSARSDSLSLFARSHVIEEENNSPKLSSNLYMHIMVHMCVCTSSCTQVHRYTHTHTMFLKRE